MPVDIALSINRTLQIPLLVVINSILINAFESEPNSSTSAFESLRFNVLVRGMSSTRPKTYAKLSSLLDRADNRHIDSGIWNPQNA